MGYERPAAGARQRQVKPGQALVTVGLIVGALLQFGCARRETAAAGGAGLRIARPLLSPAGDRLVLWVYGIQDAQYRSRVFLLQLAPRDARVLATQSVGTSAVPLGWEEDGSHWLGLAREKRQLWRLPAEGGPGELLASVPSAEGAETLVLRAQAAGLRQGIVWITTGREGYASAEVRRRASNLWRLSSPGPGIEVFEPSAALLRLVLAEPSRSPEVFFLRVGEDRHYCSLERRSLAGGPAEVILSGLHLSRFSVDVGADGRVIAVYNSNTAKIEVYRRRDSRPVKHFEFGPFDSEPGHLTLSPNGSRLAVLGQGVTFLDLSRQQILRRPRPTDAGLAGIGWGPDSSWFLCSRDLSLVVLPAQGGRERRVWNLRDHGTDGQAVP